MDFILSAFGPVGGVVVGWLLNELTAGLRFRRESRRHRDALRSELYAEWAAGMEDTLTRYAHQSTKETPAPYRVPLCEKRLLLIETDPHARALIRQVRESIPDMFSSDFERLTSMAENDPDWEWLPFQEKMHELLDYVRKSFT